MTNISKTIANESISFEKKSFNRRQKIPIVEQTTKIPANSPWSSILPVPGSRYADAGFAQKSNAVTKDMRITNIFILIDSPS